MDDQCCNDDLYLEIFLESQFWVSRNSRMLFHQSSGLACYRSQPPQISRRRQNRRTLGVAFKKSLLPLGEHCFSWFLRTYLVKTDGVGQTTESKNSPSVSLVTEVATELTVVDRGLPGHATNTLFSVLRVLCQCPYMYRFS